MKCPFCYLKVEQPYNLQDKKLVSRGKADGDKEKLGGERGDLRPYGEARAGHLRDVCVCVALFLCPLNPCSS